MAEEILIRVKSRVEHDYYDGDVGSVDLIQEQVTVDQIISEQHDYLLKSRGFAMIDPKGGKLKKETIDLLRHHGWVHAETASSREEKKVVEQEYYILDELGKQYSYSEPKIKKIDIDDLTEDQLKQLARSAKIVQCVAPKSVLPPAQYKKLQTKRKQLEEQREQAKLMVAKKAANKKAKEIAAAKKLLEEAGVQ